MLFSITVASYFSPLSSRTKHNPPPPLLSCSWKQFRHNNTKQNRKRRGGEVPRQRKNKKKKQYPFILCSEMGCLDGTVALYTAWVCSRGLLQWIILNHSVCIRKVREKNKRPFAMFIGFVIWAMTLCNPGSERSFLPHNHRDQWNDIDYLDNLLRWVIVYSGVYTNKQGFSG